MMTALRAERHGPEYLLHKYWARKPANVVSHFLAELMPEGGRLLDPFCGSGVALVEANRLGCEAVGIDLNPAACLISRVSTAPIDPSDFHACAHALLDQWRPHLEHAYGSGQLDQVRHCVHAVLVRCGGCEAEVVATECRRQGRGYHCPRCDRRLSFGMRVALGTRAVAISRGKGPLCRDPAMLASQQRAASLHVGPEGAGPFLDQPFVHNARVLAHEGLSLSKLFTPRNFSLLNLLLAPIRSLQEGALRDSVMLWFTSAIASCSRLVPYRDNMRGGGPAWSVPGFWVPPVHMERNPGLHLAARIQKFERGLAELRARRSVNRVEVVRGDCVEQMQAMGDRGEKFDLVFADPPYGDSVPYLEFSQLWNPWIEPGQPPRFEAEIVVSDRRQQPSDWLRYGRGLRRAFMAAVSLLREGGHLCLTFNNLEPAVWELLVAGLQESGLWCERVVYQLPAVISAKAAFSPGGSYVGDLFAVYRRRHERDLPRDEQWLEQRLAEVRALRGGVVSRVTQMRSASISILEGNLPARSFAALASGLGDLPSRSASLPRSSEMYRRMRGCLMSALTDTATEPGELLGRCADVLPVWAPPDLYQMQAILEDIGAQRQRGGRFCAAKARHHGASPG